MARPQATDFLQNFRFHAEVTDGADFLSFNPGGVGVDGEAGFQSITIPEETFEASEYREGIYKYTKKFPGIPTFSDVTLMRGIVATDTSFHDWAIATRGGAEYRADVQVQHHHREDAPGGTGESIAAPAARAYLLHEAFCIRAKPGADMDATSGEVSVAEVDIALEWFETQNP